MKRLRLLFVIALIPTLSAAVQGEDLPNPDKPVPPVTDNSPVTYTGELTNTPLTPGTGIPGTTFFRNIRSPSTREYYNFCGHAGDLVTTEVHRTTNAMDPAMHIWFGPTSDSDAL